MWTGVSSEWMGVARMDLEQIGVCQPGTENPEMYQESDNCEGVWTAEYQAGLNRMIVTQNSKIGVGQV